jgi:hypothetical protein
LSKSNRDEGVGALRDAGWSAQAVLGAAAARAGLLDHATPLELGDLPALFDRDRPRSR